MPFLDERNIAEKAKRYKKQEHMRSIVKIMIWMIGLIGGGTVIINLETTVFVTHLSSTTKRSTIKTKNPVPTKKVKEQTTEKKKSPKKFDSITKGVEKPTVKTKNPSPTKKVKEQTTEKKKSPKKFDSITKGAGKPTAETKNPSPTKKVKKPTTEKEKPLKEYDSIMEEIEKELDIFKKS